MNHPSPFDLLLQAAASQPEPQRLLFVFTEQRERFREGVGGTLTPLACVDKSVDELASFDALVDESRHASGPWQVVFIAALSGQGGMPPSSALVDSALQAMVNNVRAGRFRGYLALSASGEQLTFS
jgi:hypothetical protein